MFGPEENVAHLDLKLINEQYSHLLHWMKAVGKICKGGIVIEEDDVRNRIETDEVLNNVLLV